MTSDRWRKIEQIYHAALEVRDDQRAVYLREACLADSDLRREVESLLAQGKTSDPFLETPALVAAARMLGKNPNDDSSPADSSSTESSSKMIGRQMGSYQVISLLGVGGMGEVYEAQDAKLHRKVAIKVLPAAFVNDPERLTRFQREARMLAALNHPNIATIYGLEQSGATNFLVMELVPGQTLAERIKKSALPSEEALKLARQIAEGLEAAHEQGVIHRDLKPANVKVTPEGRVKVLDFGLAKTFAGIGGRGRSNMVTLTVTGTEEGIILGTPSYMSPEQARGEPVDKRTDIWAFGCVFYELLTGRQAFAGKTLTDTLAATLEREPDWQALPASTPNRIRDLLGRCLTKDSRRRLRDLGEARLAIEDVVSPPPLASAAGGNLAGHRQRGMLTKVIGTGEPIPGLRWWIAGIAAALLAVGLVAGGLGVLRFRQPAASASPLRLMIDPPQGGAFFFGNNLGGIALSPDGKTAAFVATVNGETALWVRPLDDTAARMLSGTDGAYYPFWSPDSKSLAFFTGYNKLQSIELAGGTPSTICDFSSASGGSGGRGGFWASDGQIVFGVFGGSLFRVPAAGGAPSPLTTVDASHGELDHRWPQLLPGGRLLFWVRGDKPESTGVYAASLANPNERVHLLTTNTGALYAPGNDGKNYLVWQREGKLVAQEFDPGTLKLMGEFRLISNQVAANAPVGQMMASASASGLLLYSSASTVSQFTWFDRNGKRMGTVGDPGEYENFSLSPDARRVMAARDKPGGSDLWLLETQRGVASRFTSRPGNNNYPIWSPSSAAIVFRSVFSLARKEVTGIGDVERLTESTNNQYPSDWSRDGKSVVYHEAAQGTGYNLWVLPVTPDGRPETKPRLYLRTQYDELHGRFSPEPKPRWVAYDSNESGRFEVYVDAFPEPRNKLRISTGGGRYPEWSSDGRELFYVSPDLKLMAVTLKTGADAIETSTPRELFALPVFENGYNLYDVAPDGQRFLVLALPEGQLSEPLTLLSNWPALLDQPPAQ